MKQDKTMMYKNIKCIDEILLDKKIEELEKPFNDWSKEDDVMDKFFMAKGLRLVKQHLTSATPILEKAFEAGRNDNYEEVSNDGGETYETINNRPTFEQFLNTEVNI